ncbi:MAG: HEAT repeat domain-containing protein [Candidatus Krumholzibacteria bacterium]|nr:HEAT repeat domain-containing protein [Candidatus Krumholzibacteria bacterium]
MGNTKLGILFLALMFTVTVDASAASRYQSLLATSAGRDSLLRLALWEDGRVTGDGQLFQYLRSSNPLIRLRAVEAIGRIQDPQDVTHLTPMLGDSDPRVVLEAVFALGQIGSQEAVPKLIELNRKTVAEVQQVVLEALGKIGGVEATDELREMLHAFKGPVRAAAAMALAKIESESAINALLVSIHDGDAKVAWRAIHSLETADSKRVRESIVPFLRSESPLVRAYAARTLGKIKANNAVESLTEAASDSDLRVACNSIQALGTILENHRDQRVVTALAALAEEHPSHHVRKAVVMSIGQIGHKSAKDFLLQSILDRNVGIRAESYKSLAKVLGKNAIVFVSAGLNDSDTIVRAAVVEALGLCREEKQIPDLLSIAREDKDAKMRAAAVRGLANLKKDEVRDALVEKLQDEDWVVATEAVTALGKIGDKNVIPALIDRFSMRNDRVDTDVRLEIMSVLKEMKAKEAEQIARDALEANDPRLRQMASDLLDELGVERPPLRGNRYFYERDFDASRKADLSLPMGKRKAIIRTEHGDVEIELFGDDATQTVANFVKLAQSGDYDKNKGMSFHRVVANFVIQGGCPRGDGWGDPGYNIRSEFNQHHYDRGMVGIAHAGKDTGGSQFFITHSPQPHLDGRYTIFGRVIKGMDIVDRVAQGDKFSVVIVE